MKKSLSHLPQHKQEEILKIVEIIKEVAQPEKIILFGSYARGGWVEDEYVEDGIRYEYVSDYDFLLATHGNNEKDYVIADRIINRTNNLFKTPVNPIIHSIEYVNEGLERGQYFFTDIVKEGVELFDSGKTSFSKAKELSAEEQKQKAQNYYDIWFTSGDEFLNIAIYSADLYKNKAAFLLHQAAESFYNATLLVFTGYKPKTHNLEKLRRMVKSVSKEVYAVFPECPDDKQEAELFELLKRGYVDARYKNDYFISSEELKLLIGKIQKLKQAVKNECLNTYNFIH